MAHDVIIVGGGIAGLTAAAYLSKAGYSCLLLEKEKNCGGLVTSFKRDGIYYDGGIRAMENSGILFPMLKQLGLELDFVKNNISLGIEDRIFRISSPADISIYQEILSELYPNNVEDIEAIMTEILRIMKLMDVQYAIDNPMFLEIKTDREYMLKKIVPWIFRYAFASGKIRALNEPVEEYLKKFTDNQSLIDIITQHFFKHTPASFALSYITLYLDYHYPLGGTGKVIKKIADYIKVQNGEIRNNVTITKIIPSKKEITSVGGEIFKYRRLIWAADLKTLYHSLDLTDSQDISIKNAVTKRMAEIEDKKGNDSVFTLFLGVSLDTSYFGSIASEHFFYTPSKTGESQAGPLPIGLNKEEVKQWLKDFFSFTTYEISIPALRDASLTPSGKTGLVISVLFDYDLTEYIHKNGWYDEFKAYSQECILETLIGTIYPRIKGAIIHQFSSSPLTMKRLSGNTDGAITGWSFTNNPVPAESQLTKILSAVKTPIPGIFKAGQWTYSPAGFPISILTGKLAADGVMKELGKITN
jgi:phytoene dehydrogenase-like protein